MHRRHTITKLDISLAQLSFLLKEEDRLGKRIHDPKSIFNPDERRLQYHWHFRGHDRQIRFDMVEVICSFLSECAIVAR